MIIDYNTNGRATGIDLSEHNVPVNIRPDAPLPIDFFIQRLSTGLKTDLAYDYLQSVILGYKIRGAYHFYQSSYDWRKQSELILRLLTSGKVKYHFFALDYELHIINKFSEQTDEDMLRMLDFISPRFDGELLIYTNPSTYIQRLNDEPEVLKYGLWISQYWLNQSPSKNPSFQVGNSVMRRNPNDWKFYQWSADNPSNNAGKLFGVKSQNIDLNVFNGTLLDLQRYLGISSELPTPEPEEPVEEPEVIIVESSNRQFARAKHDYQWYTNNAGDRISSRFHLEDWHWTKEDFWYPETVPFTATPRDGITENPYSWEMIKTLRTMNDLDGQAFIENRSGGLFNRRSPEVPKTEKDYNPNNPPVAEGLTSGGNVLEILEVRGKYVRAKMLPYDHDMRGISYGETPEFVTKFTSVNPDGFFGLAGGRHVYFPNYGRGEHWLPLERVELFPKLPMEVTVTASPALRVRSGAGTKFPQVASIARGTTITVYDYELRGSDVWGKIGKDEYVALLITIPGNSTQKTSQYFTSWKMETTPPHAKLGGEYKPTAVTNLGTYRVNAFPWLNVRNAPDATATKIKHYYPYTNTTLLETKQVGDDVWGRTVDGWVALKYRGSYYTSWK